MVRRPALRAVQAATCVVLLVAAVFAVRSGDRNTQLLLPTTRVQATPVATPVPQPAALPPDGLENSGGGIAWAPTRDAGPFATDGTIALPTLGVRAPIVRVGVNLKNQIELPSNSRDVAWFDQGPIPGTTQNVVLAGHKNWSGVVGSFNSLDQLHPGDPVILSMGGRTWIFRTIWVRMYDPATAPVDKLMGFTEVPSVTLVTCGGTFDPSIRHYRSRMIARAQLASAT